MRQLFCSQQGVVTETVNSVSQVGDVGVLVAMLVVLVVTLSLVVLSWSR